MKLALKLTAALTLGILAVMAAYAYLQVRQEVVLFEGDLRKNARVARSLRATVQDVWRMEGEDRAMALIEEADDAVSELAIRWVWLDVAPAEPRSPKLPPERLRELVNGELVRVEREDPPGEWRRYTYVPMSVPGKRPAALEFSESLMRQLTYVRLSRLAIAWATVGIAALCGLIATALGVWFVGRPIRLLRDQARRVAAGDFSSRVVLRQHDEIRDLADEINAMCERIAEGNRKLADETAARIAAVERLRHADRLATVGQLAAGIAHGLGTPLNVISARAGMIAAGDASPAEAADSARVIAEQSDRMADLIRQLLDFSRREEVRPGPADLQHVVARTLDLLSSLAEKQRVRLRYDADKQPFVAEVDENQMQQALTNVIVNGIQAMPGGGRLTVRLGARRARPPAAHGGADGSYLAISVEDEGQGIPREDIPHIFEPFFTTKGSGEGTGLGLAVAHGIVTEHGGWIDVESDVGRGARFTIFLPAAGRQEALLEIAS